jgi:hypothetical protein
MALRNLLTLVGLALHATPTTSANTERGTLLNVDEEVLSPEPGSGWAGTLQEEGGCATDNWPGWSGIKYLFAL